MLNPCFPYIFFLMQQLLFFDEVELTMFGACIIGAVILVERFFFFLVF